MSSSSNPSETPTNSSTSGHPGPSAPDPSTALTSTGQTPARPSNSTASIRQDESRAENSQSATHASSAPQLSSLTLNLSKALRQIPDFPQKGIVFEDICPIFRNHSLLNDLITALELLIATENGGPGKPDLIVGLDARGFLFGPALALRVGAGFAPVRKAGKLPGSVISASFEKEYGSDEFQIQDDAIEKGQKVLVIDDIIATGGSASAAGELVRKLGGDLIGYVFLLELDFLKGRDKLDAPVWTLLTGQKK